MSIEDDVALLERVPTLRLLGTTALRMLAIGSEQRDVARDDLLFSIGDDADSGFIVQRGAFQISFEDGSGAEIVAGGSIHIYGTLRGRAMAGANGNSAARIYCQKIEAELLAIDGHYQTAEEIDPSLCNQPAQVRLEGNIMKITPLN